MGDDRREAVSGTGSRIRCGWDECYHFRLVVSLVFPLTTPECARRSGSEGYEARVRRGPPLLRDRKEARL